MVVMVMIKIMLILMVIGRVMVLMVVWNLVLVAAVTMVARCGDDHDIDSAEYDP